MDMDSSLAILLDAGTAVVADVFDSLGQLPPVLDNSLFAIPRGARFAGPAYTIAGEPQRWTSGGDRAKLAAIDGLPAGSVAVWAGGDIRGVCCFGDLLASAMRARGCAGVLVDGGVRDVAFLETLGLPILARYRTPAQAIGRWRVTASQQPVRLRGALEDWLTVNPGDYMVADGDGAIVAPAGLLAEVATRVAEWSRSETGARDDIRAGLPLLAAIEKYGHL